MFAQLKAELEPLGITVPEDTVMELYKLGCTYKVIRNAVRHKHERPADETKSVTVSSEEKGVSAVLRYAAQGDTTTASSSTPGTTTRFDALELGDFLSYFVNAVMSADDVRPVVRAGVLDQIDVNNESIMAKFEEHWSAAESIKQPCLRVYPTDSLEARVLDALFCFIGNEPRLEASFIRELSKVSRMTGEDKDELVHTWKRMVSEY